MAKAQPASFLAGYALEMWWSGSWLGRGSNITELVVRTQDNAQSVIGKVPKVNMLNLPNLCPRSEILEVLPSVRPMPEETLEEPPMTRIPKMLPGPRETPNGQSGVNQQQHCDEGPPKQYIMRKQRGPSRRHDHRHENGSERESGEANVAGNAYPRATGGDKPWDLGVRRERDNVGARGDESVTQASDMNGMTYVEFHSMFGELKQFGTLKLCTRNFSEERDG